MNSKADNDITVRFPSIGLEVRLLNGSLLVDQGKMNYFKGEFSNEVRELIKAELDGDGSLFSFKQEAQVRINGETKYQMMLFPDGIVIGEDSCWIRLDDPQKILKEQSIDVELESTTGRDIYKKIFDRLPSSDILKGIEFNVSDKKTVKTDKGADGVVDALENPISAVGILPGLGLESVQGAMEGNFDISFDSLNCLEAIWKVNKKLHLTSWTDGRGYLQIGSPELGKQLHLASERDSRVWRFKDPRIRRPADQIKAVVVNGDIASDVEIKESEDYKEILRRENVSAKEAFSGKGLIAQGIAQLDSVESGKVIRKNAKGMKKNSLESIAKESLKEEIRNQNSGSVSIDTQLSGTEFSDYSDVQIGDLINLTAMPESDCLNYGNNQSYLITGINHNFDMGYWDIDLDVVMYPDDTVTTDMRYFDPVSGAYYKDGEFIYEG